MDLSIIILSYNYDKYIQECIDSCIFQKDVDIKYEIIIIDDGSSDNTKTILKSVKIKMSKLKYEKSQEQNDLKIPYPKLDQSIATTPSACKLKLWRHSVEFENSQLDGACMKNALVED